MNRFCHRARVIISVYSSVVLLGMSGTAHAGGFSDAFRDFVLGSEANASTVPAVQLPAKSQARNCMQCHNGSAGPRINMKHAGAPMQFLGNISIDHPIGMDYNQYASRHPESYIVPARMDKRILFEDGKITCVSCHQTETRPTTLSKVTQPRSDKQHCNVGTGYTTGPNRTRLCMSCHAM